MAVANRCRCCNSGTMDLSFADLVVITHVVIIVSIGLRIVSRQPPASVAFAWLMLVTAMPFGGAFAYMMIGERRISAERTRRFERSRKLRRQSWERALQGNWQQSRIGSGTSITQGLGRLGWVAAASPTVSGDVTQLSENYDEMIDGMVADIDAAKLAVLLETYIWEQSGRINEIAQALQRAAKRGVTCHVLVDAVGSSEWLRDNGPAELEGAGVKVTAALPVGIWHNVFGRADLRMHRKIMTVDATAGWTGSMNMVDPRYFKQDAGVGEWMDAMVRVEGGIVVALIATVLADLAQEPVEGLDKLIAVLDLENRPNTGNLAIQAIPSGPGTIDDGLQLMLISLISSAQRELIITTPYFAPDDAVLKALRAAAARGVAVSLVVPKRIDSLMVRFASHSFFQGLLELGVEIYEFGDGLLHTKSITADGQIAMFGSVNMDYRSLWLNYEIALFFYSEEFVRQLLEVQLTYIRRSSRIDLAVWQRHPLYARFAQNLFRLLSPVL